MDLKFITVLNLRIKIICISDIFFKKLILLYFKLIKLFTNSTILIFLINELNGEITFTAFDNNMRKGII